MSTSADTIVTADVAGLTERGLPLSELLRAAAAEAPARRNAGALRRLAAAIESGRPLEEALADARLRLPSGVAALLAAGGEQGEVHRAMGDLVEFDAASRDLFRMVYAALVYPLGVALFAYFCLVFVLFVLVAPLAQMYREFEMTMPISTAMLARWHEYRYALLAAPVVLGVALAFAPLLLGRARCDRILAALPVIGPLFYLAGAALALRAVAHLVERRVPLPAALRQSASSLRDHGLAETWRQLATEVEAGRRFSNAMLGTHRVPASVGPLVRWGEATQNFAESLLLASDLLAGRVRLRAELIRGVVPPVMFIVIGGMAYLVAVALLSPMLWLVQSLSG